MREGRDSPTYVQLETHREICLYTNSTTPSFSLFQSKSSSTAKQERLNTSTYAGRSCMVLPRTAPVYDSTTARIRRPSQSQPRRTQLSNASVRRPDVGNNYLPGRDVPRANLPAGGTYPPFCEGLQTAWFAAGLQQIFFPHNGVDFPTSRPSGRQIQRRRLPG
jgi:hypothetical protein